MGNKGLLYFQHFSPLWFLVTEMFYFENPKSFVPYSLDKEWVDFGYVEI